MDYVHLPTKESYTLQQLHWRRRQWLSAIGWCCGSLGRKVLRSVLPPGGYSKQRENAGRAICASEAVQGQVLGGCWYWQMPKQ